VPFELHDYRGPLGAIEPQLAQRRIAVAADDAGQLFLVRPDSVILEFDERGFEDVQRVIADDSLEVLGGPVTEPPPSGFLATRPGPDARRQTAPTRWDTGGLRPLADRFASERCTVRPHQVYLTDGVAQHFRVVTENRPSRRPAQAVPVSTSSTARPAAAPLTLPAPLRLSGHRPPNVLVLDTGLRTRDRRVAHPWLRDHCVLHTPWRDLRTVGRWDDEDEPDDDRGGRLDVQAGHGTFISGVIRQQCPDARIHHRGVLTSYGDGDDASVIAAIERATRGTDHEFDLVVMAFGTYSTSGTPPPMATAIERLLTDPVIVASAGNDATSRPTYPAALPGVVAVGALDGGSRAAFSNFGPWVDACAPAVDVVSTFFDDVDDRTEDGELREQYRGWARWSGTSFAAPKVAGVIAQELYLHAGTAVEAWRRVQARADFRIPDLGILVNC
jgi:hypothetical protein